MFPSSPPPLNGVVHIDVRVDRSRWHVATAGDRDAPPIVLLHGWPQHWWTWRKVIGRLAKEHRVYVPDLRGFGWSDAPEGRYTKMGLAADVVALLDELEVETAHVVGHDWGGFIAWLVAVREPERVERLSTFNIIHPWLVPERNLRQLLSSLYIPILSTPGLGTGVMRFGPAAMRQVFQRAVAPGFRWNPTDVRLYVDAFRRPEHARAASALYRTFLTRELPAMSRGRYANRRVEVPVLAVTGRYDPVITPERLAGIEAHVPDLETVTIEDGGHFLPEEHPSRVAELILARR